MSQVDFASSQAKYPAPFSGGVPPRPALAQALIMNPKVLVLKRGTGDLDPGIRAEIQRRMKRLRHETQMAIVTVAHGRREAVTLTTRAIAFKRPQNQPEEEIRYGATISREVAVSAPGDAEAPAPFNPDRDGPVLSLGPRQDDLALTQTEGK